MTTNTTTTNSTTPNSTPKTSRRLVAAIVAGGLAIAGITAAVTMTLETPAAHAQTTSPASSSSSSTSHSGSTTHHGDHHSHHALTPSQSTKTLQSQLAELNYYNGPISGYWNSETTNAIDYESSRCCRDSREDSRSPRWPPSSTSVPPR